MVVPKVLKRSLVPAAILLLGFLAWSSFQPQPVLSDLGLVTVAPLRVTVDDDGRTRVRQRYTISAPIQGQLLRLTLEPGDPVRAGETVVAEFLPVVPALLDARSLTEANARVQRAVAAVAEAGARLAQQKAEVVLAERELARQRDLAMQRISGQADLERAERDLARAQEGQHAAEFAVQIASFEVELAEASLKVPPVTAQGHREDQERETPTEPRRMQLRSPIDGRVLRVFEESTRTMAAGTAILEIGDLDSLEVVAELLTQHAMLVRPDMAVSIHGFSGANQLGAMVPDLQARVRLVEPSGFTKISALGVEEQRVLVRMDPVEPGPAWQALGDGYRVEASILLWEEEVLQVPAGALFQQGGSHAVYVVINGRARKREVTVGRRNALQTQVLSGLTAGEQVILYPSDLLHDGAPIQAR